MIAALRLLPRTAAAAWLARLYRARHLSILCRKMSRYVDDDLVCLLKPMLVNIISIRQVVNLLQQALDLAQSEITRRALADLLDTITRCLG
jgi:hypothetical protein